MREVELAMMFCGEVFTMTVKVSDEYFIDGRLQEHKLKNRLEGNGRVLTMETVEPRPGPVPHWRPSEEDSRAFLEDRMQQENLPEASRERLRAAFQGARNSNGMSEAVNVEKRSL